MSVGFVVTTREESIMKKALRRFAVVSTVAAATLLPLTGASAQTVGNGCGSTITTSCSDTEHYSTRSEWLGGGLVGATCPAYFNDWGLESGTGNGVSHVNINKDGDEWVSDTWSGSATITFYPSSSVDIVADQDGNVTSATITGPPEAVLTGHSTNWFGASFNNQNSALTFTFAFEGTDQGGTPIKVHGDEHATWVPGADPFGPPSISHAHMVCS
jgi:hypothetical protein